MLIKRSKSGIIGLNLSNARFSLMATCTQAMEWPISTDALDVLGKQCCCVSDSASADAESESILAAAHAAAVHRLRLIVCAPLHH